MKNLKSTCSLTIRILACFLITMVVFSYAAIGTASAELTNVALGKSAAQSSTAYNGPPGLAVDGNTDGNYYHGSISHTGYDYFGPWWQVDLGESYNIDHISVWNRTDCCGERLKNYYVFVSDNPFGTNSFSELAGRSDVFSSYQANAAGTPTEITVNRSGRYVRIQIDHPEYLHISEVEVWSAGTESGEGGGGESFPILSAIPSFFELFN